MSTLIRARKSRRLHLRRAYDRKRDTEQATRPLYKTARWQRWRERQLMEEPYCCRCSTDERPVLGDVANHKIPHRGNVELFWNNTLETVCTPCHSSAIQREERGGKGPQELDEFGWPL